MCTVGMGVYYCTHDGGGDMGLFYRCADAFWQVAVEEPAWAAEFWFQREGTHAAEALPVALQQVASFKPEDAAHWRLLTLFYGVTGGSFWALALLYSAFALGGVWWLYRVLAQVFPRSAVPMGVLLLGWPLSTFWTSAFQKEAVAIGCLGLLLGGLIRLAQPRPWRWPWWAAVAIGAFGIWVLKPWVLYALLPGLILATSLGVWPGRTQLRVWQRLALGVGVLVVLGVVTQLAGRGVVNLLEYAYMVREYSLLEVLPVVKGPAATTYLPHAGPDAWQTFTALPRGLWLALSSPMPHQAFTSSGKATVAVNLAMGLLLVWAVVAVVRRPPRFRADLPTAVAVGLGLYSAIYLAMMGVAMPFVGTLVRYRSLAIPLVLVLVAVAIWERRPIKR